MQKLITRNEIKNELSRIEEQYKFREDIRSKGIENAKNFLFVGGGGTGKTLAAKHLAEDLGLKFCEKSAAEMSVFPTTVSHFSVDSIEKYMHGGSVLVLHDFDAFLSEEHPYLLKRLFDIVSLNHDSIFIAEINHHLYNMGILHRFDGVIYFSYLTKELTPKLLDEVFSSYGYPNIKFSDDTIGLATGVSPAEVVNTCKEVIRIMAIPYVIVNPETKLHELLKQRRNTFNLVNSFGN